MEGPIKINQGEKFRSCLEKQRKGIIAFAGFNYSFSSYFKQTDSGGKNLFNWGLDPKTYFAKWTLKSDQICPRIFCYEKNHPNFLIEIFKKKIVSHFVSCPENIVLMSVATARVS